MPMILDTHSSEPQTTLIDPREDRRRVHHEADVVIVGAGILGSAIATTFARQGRSVILLEKSLKQPDRIVGELLQPGGVDALAKLGLRDCLDGIDAIEVNGYECIYHGEPVLIPYPQSDSDGAQTKRQGRSFHHGRFVQRLREAAMRELNVTVVETTATSLVKSSMTGQVLGVECKTKGAKDYYFGDLTIISDGYASTFRDSTFSPEHPPTQPRKATTRSKFYALELQDCPLPSPTHGHVILGTGAPVLLYQIGTHETRALIDIPNNTPSASVANGGVKGHLRKQVFPDLPPCVQSSFSDALARAEHPEDYPSTKDAPPPLRSMPNSFLPAMTNTTPGLVLLGDALNMRHPLTGGGMTVALNDVLTLSTLLSPAAIPSFSATPKVLRALSTFHWRRKRLSSVINILAQALYSLFAADDEQLRALQNGCFRYFQLGGAAVAGPCGLLAGLTKRPFVLFAHFFAVALYGMWIFVFEGPRKCAPRPQGCEKAATNGRADAGKDELVSLDERETDAPRIMPDVAGWQSSRGKSRHELDLLGAPYRMLVAPAIFYKACCVLLPYIWAELRPS